MQQWPPTLPVKMCAAFPSCSSPSTNIPQLLSLFVRSTSVNVDQLTSADGSLPAGSPWAPQSTVVLLPCSFAPASCLPALQPVTRFQSPSRSLVQGRSRRRDRSVEGTTLSLPQFFLPTVFFSFFCLTFVFMQIFLQAALYQIMQLTSAVLMIILTWVLHSCVLDYFSQTACISLVIHQVYKALW